MWKRRFIFVIALTAVVFCFRAAPFLQSLGNRTARFAAGQHLLGSAPIHGRNSLMNLPSAEVESGGTLCCRMVYCDFRFPLPAGTRVARIAPITGGRDTIQGAICVTNADGGNVDMSAYGRRLRRAGFSVHSRGDSLTASSPDGGYVVAGIQDHAARISFSFFGDY